MRVLLVEPDRLLARTYRSAFELAGHKVMAVVSAQAAVHAADQHQPDVVVLEMELPRHNGVEFLYEFRSYHEWCHVPVIIHSIVPPRALMAATLEQELGVVRILHKPVTSLAQLRAAVEWVATNQTI